MPTYVGVLASKTSDLHFVMTIATRKNFIRAVSTYLRP